MTDALECFPTGCGSCHHRTAGGGCELARLLHRNDVVDLNDGSGPVRSEHPIDEYATA